LISIFWQILLKYTFFVTCCSAARISPLLFHCPEFQTHTNPRSLNHLVRRVCLLSPERVCTCFQQGWRFCGLPSYLRCRTSCFPVCVPSGAEYAVVSIQKSPQPVAILGLCLVADITCIARHASPKAGHVISPSYCGQTGPIPLNPKQAGLALELCNSQSGLVPVTRPSNLSL